MGVAITFCILFHFYVYGNDGWQLKHYDPNPNPKAVIQTKQARFTILTKNVIRMEYDPSGTFENRSSRIFVNRFTQPPKFTVSNDSSSSTLRINTEHLTLVYKGGDFTSSSLTIYGNTTNLQFEYKPSGDTNIDNGWSNNLFGTILALDDSIGDISLNCTENYHHPFDEYLHPHCEWAFIGMNGYAVIDDTDTTMMDMNDDWFSLKPNKNIQDLYFFGHGLDFKQALYDYTKIAGSVPMIPRYGLGSWHTRWYHYSDASLRSMVDVYESMSIPLDVVVFDMNWHYLNAVHDPWGSYSWSDLLFPEPNITQQWLHETMNLRTAGNLHDHNGIQTTETYYDAAAKVLNVTNGKDIPANISDYKYMMILQDIILEPIANTPTYNGFDVWWIDWQQGMQDIYLNDKITPTYILSYVRGTNNIRKERNVRDMVLGRCGGYGSHRYPVGFSGDQIHDWSSLQYLVYFTSTAANVLISWSHDIYGGHSLQGFDLNTRWIQFGAYSPMFRIHDKGQGTGVCALADACAEPDIWRHPFKYFVIEGDAIQQRAELLPYIYNASYTAYKTGLLLVRSMYIDYALESMSYPIKNAVVKQQYMFGESMIVSPITQKGDLYDVVAQNIWLPSADEFYEKHSGKVLQNKDSSSILSRSFSLSEIPIYVKTGSIIPISPFHNREVLGKANEICYDRLRFDIYPSLSNEDQRGSTVTYEDDGITFDYLSENETSHVQTYVDWKYNSKTNEFEANIVSKGDYVGFITNRYYGVRIYNVLSPKSVMCNKNAVKYNAFYFNHIAKENTYYFDGKTMSLTINCPQTAANTSTRISVLFARNWSEDFKYSSLYGMKGKINRANQCKSALDEVNYAYGTRSRSNMTLVATYSMLLGNIGNDYEIQYNYVQQFDDLWQNALLEVTNIDETLSSSKRYTFCNDLYKTI